MKFRPRARIWVIWETPKGIATKEMHSYVRCFSSRTEAREYKSKGTDDRVYSSPQALHMAPRWSRIFRRRVWVLFDMSNGDGRKWLWNFATKKAAIAHRNKQNSDPECARLEGPFDYYTSVSCPD